MASNNEWQFDLLETLYDLLKEPLNLDTLDKGVDSRRLVGETRGSNISGGPEPEHVSILVKPVGPNNAATFKRWVTLSPNEAEGLVEGPRGWKGYVAMIGLLDDGQPWWIALYSRDDLRATAHAADRKETHGGGWFWRWDPGLVKPVVFKDYTEPEGSDDDAPWSDAEIRALFEDVVAGRWSIDKAVELVKSELQAQP